MTLTAIERLSPFCPDFTWDEYTNELYRISDEYGFLTVEQMQEEIQRFKMFGYSNLVTCSSHVEEFVDFLYDANSD